MQNDIYIYLYIYIFFIKIYIYIYIHIGIYLYTHVSDSPKHPHCQKLGLNSRCRKPISVPHLRRTGWLSCAVRTRCFGRWSPRPLKGVRSSPIEELKVNDVPELGSPPICFPRSYSCRPSPSTCLKSIQSSRNQAVFRDEEHEHRRQVWPLKPAWDSGICYRCLFSQSISDIYGIPWDTQISGISFA